MTARRMCLISSSFVLAGVALISYLAARSINEPAPALICEPMPPIGVSAKDGWRPVGVLDRASVAWMADRGEVEIRFFEKSAWCYEARDPLKGHWVVYKWWKPRSTP